MEQEWIATQRKARVKTLNILKILGSYPSNTSFSKGAFWSHTGQIHVVFLQNIKPVYFDQIIDQIIASNKKEGKYNTIWTVTRVVGYKSSCEFVKLS